MNRLSSHFLLSNPRVEHLLSVDNTRLCGSMTIDGLDDMNNTISLSEMKSIFIQKCFIVPAIQHGCLVNPSYF